MISSNVKRLMAAKGLTNHTMAARARISADTVARTKSERIREGRLFKFKQKISTVNLLR